VTLLSVGDLFEVPAEHLSLKQPLMQNGASLYSLAFTYFKDMTYVMFLDMTETVS